MKEVKRNLLGSLEIALFMPIARSRFGNSKNEAFRSFLIPTLLFPITLFMVIMSPKAGMSNDSAHVLALLYTLRLFVTWFFFFGAVYWIAQQVGKMQHFYQFVIASNWITVPATAIFIPVLFMLYTGAYPAQELYLFTMCLLAYTYCFSAFMAAYVMRIPWELAGFITFVGICVNNSTMDALTWITNII